jgi:hypothetical protein
MSEKSGSFVGVILFAIVCGALAYLFVWQNGNIIEKILAVAAIIFCLGMLVKQRWALIGVCLTLLVAIGVYFTQLWLQPIVAEDTSLIMPNLVKMVVGILLFIYIGRERIEHGVF